MKKQRIIEPEAVAEDAVEEAAVEEAVKVTVESYLAAKGVPSLHVAGMVTYAKSKKAPKTLTEKEWSTLFTTY